MKKVLLSFVLMSLFVQSSMAQAPKWVEKAKRAVFSVVTYDKSDKILNTGNGFFVSEDGVALSDYTLFKDAERAVIINSEGKQMPVNAILGANEMYDVIKFRVGITEKRVPALVVTATAPVVQSEVYLLPYSTQKDRNCTQGVVKEVSKIGDKYHYYTLSMELKDKMVSCPVATADGQVFGLAQKSSGKDTASVCYAVSALFALSQSIGPLSLGEAVYRNIGIKKSLPEVEDQALVYLYMASSQTTPEIYLSLLNDFVKQYPQSTDGYIRRAASLIFTAKDESNFIKAMTDYKQALNVAKVKNDVYYAIAMQMYNYRLNKPENPYKDWTYDTALEYVRKALAIDSLPAYTQLEGDILFAKQDYVGALSNYQKVNRSNLASPITFFNAAKTMELVNAAPQEVVAMMDSCIAYCTQPITEADAGYLLERAQMNMNAEQYRAAMSDYDAYLIAVNGAVNDVFYYYREQSAMKARQYQRALNDIVKAIELNPKELTYRAEQAVINLRVARYDEAIRILKDALVIDPKYAEAYRLMGVCQIQLKQEAEACANFAKAKELGDTNVDELIKKHCK